jgi:hypothetical protein
MHSHVALYIGAVTAIDSLLTIGGFAAPAPAARTVLIERPATERGELAELKSSYSEY